MRPKILSAGVIVVRRNPDKWLYLLLRAYNHWDFPKGIVESGEAPLEAAIRETEEETCIADLKFNWGYCYRESGPNTRGKVVRYYLAETRTAQIMLPVTEELGRPEHDEYRWLSYLQARSLLKPRQAEVLLWAYDLVEA